MDPDGERGTGDEGRTEQRVSQYRFPRGEKVPAGGDSIKQHMNPKAQRAKLS